MSIAALAHHHATQHACNGEAGPAALSFCTTERKPWRELSRRCPGPQGELGATRRTRLEHGRWAAEALLHDAQHHKATASRVCGSCRLRYAFTITGYLGRTFMKRESWLFLVLAGWLVASPASGATTWSWEFSDTTLNLATEQTAYITIRNDPSSDADLLVEGVSLMSFGDYGVLYEPGHVGIIMPTVLDTGLNLAPGEEATGAAIYFWLLDSNLPTPGVSYEISPTLWAKSGFDCRAMTSNCELVGQPPSRPLNIVYAPVPELNSATQFLIGLALLSPVLLRRRSSPGRQLSRLSDPSRA